MAATETVRTFLPDVEGSVRLVDGIAGSVDLHVRGCAFPIEISVPTKRGEVRQAYAMRLHFLRGRLDRVTLTRELPGGEEHEAVQYAIDCSFGVRVEEWTCNCDDFARRGWKRKCPACKHVKACHKVAKMLGAI